MLIPDTAVPRYFFYIHVDVDVARDVIGIDLPDLNEAIAEANKARLEIMDEEDFSINYGSKSWMREDASKKGRLGKNSRTDGHREAGRPDLMPNGFESR